MAGELSTRGPVPGGTRSTGSAFVSSNRELVGVYGSAGADLSAGRAARCRQPANITRFATFGGSGCAVPGVGLPVAGLPGVCADTVAAPAAIATTTANHAARRL